MNPVDLKVPETSLFPTSQTARLRRLVCCIKNDRTSRSCSFCPRFIDQNDAVGVAIIKRLFPLLAFPGDIVALLFDGNPPFLSQSTTQTSRDPNEAIV